MEDFGLIVSSFRSQYGIRLSTELSEMKWDEFSDLLAGLSPDTALGRIVRVRAENDPEMIKHFSSEQLKIRSEWRNKRAKEIPQDKMEEILKNFEKMFMEMAGEA